MDPATIFGCLYAFFFASSIWDVYLSYRQYVLYRCTTSRPDYVSEIISDADYAKARAYQLDRMQFGFVDAAFNFVVHSIIFLGTFYPWIWNTCSQIAVYIWPAGGEIWHSIIFVCVSSIVETLISLPFSYYSTFFIEQKHGFNNETVPFFFKDRTLKLGVSLAISAPVVALLVWIIRNGGPNFHIYAWLAISMFIFVMMFVYPEFIAPLFDKYTPLPDSELKRKIEALAAQVGFPLAKLYVVENSKRSSHSNAYMYGFWKNKRIVLFDTLLSKEMNELIKKKTATEDEHKSKRKDDAKASPEEQQTDKSEEAEEAEKNAEGSTVPEPATTTASNPDNDDEGVQKTAQNENDEKSDGAEKQQKRQIGMDDDEVVAILGHELGHWKMGHQLMNLAFTEVNLLIMLFVFSLFHQQENLFAAFGFPPARQQPILVGLLIISRFVLAPYSEFCSLLVNVVTRKCEFAADNFSATLGHASKLATGLKKLAKDNLSLPVDDWLYSWCNHSHPPIPERIEAMKKFE